MRALVMIGLLVLASLPSCTIMSKAPPLDIRYFSPETMDARRAPPAETPALARIRMGRLTSSANLRYRIVRRESAVELDTYETLRWTETPADYVRRSLGHALFDSGRFEQVVGGPALTLDVVVVAFEEARREAKPVGRVMLEYHLHDERSVVASNVIVVERPAANAEIEPVVAAIGAAMDGATAQLADELAVRVRR